jgi:hypothetical protein
VLVVQRLTAQGRAVDERVVGERERTLAAICNDAASERWSVLAAEDDEDEDN